MRRKLKAITLIALLCFTFPAFAQPAATAVVKLTGIYSDMSYNSDGDDVLGDEVFLVFSDRGYYVVFQGSEGEPYAPVVVPAKVDDTSISFSLPAAVDPRGEFQGKIANGELVGTFTGNKQTLRLKRKRSYWQ